MKKSSQDSKVSLTCATEHSRKMRQPVTVRLALILVVRNVRYTVTQLVA